MLSLMLVIFYTLDKFKQINLLGILAVINKQIFALHNHNYKKVLKQNCLLVL